MLWRFLAPVDAKAYHAKPTAAPAVTPVVIAFIFISYSMTIILTVVYPLYHAKIAYSGYISETVIIYFLKKIIFYS